MTIWIIIDNREIWYMYDVPDDRELNRVTIGETSLYSYDLLNNTAQKYDGSEWNNVSVSNHTIIDGDVQLRFNPNQIFEYFNNTENKWIIIPEL